VLVGAVDLHAEPWVLTLPKTDGRYYTTQWDDMWGFVLDNPGAPKDGIADGWKLIKDTEATVKDACKLFGTRQTPELTKAKDGSITIYVQKDSPGKHKEGNWLPAPVARDEPATPRPGPGRGAHAQESQSRTRLIELQAKSHWTAGSQSGTIACFAGALADFCHRRSRNCSARGARLAPTVFSRLGR
jgi:hypothetical protein